MKKYILYPGYILDNSNNGRQYIFSYELANLYGVKWSECIISFSGEKLDENSKCLIPLHPRSDGNYGEKLDGLSKYTFSYDDWKIL